MIFEAHKQGTVEWKYARAGVITASRFCDARARTGGLNEQQAKYVAALRAGAVEATARTIAGYKAKPTAECIDLALQGIDTSRPSEGAEKYAWLLAMERIAGEPLDDTFETYAMRRGSELEPEARRAYEERTGNMAQEAGIVFTPDRKFGYSTDGYVEDDGLIEVKCPMACDKLGLVWTKPEQAAAEYIDQIDGGLWITGRKWCDLVVYCPWLEPVGKALFIKRIWRDDDRIEAIESDLVKFSALVDSYEAKLRTPVLDAVDARMSAGDPPWDTPKSNVIPANPF